ncbi:MAG: type III pantothenate kinase [Lachnospiraceae bacterium]|nr:type III pantothenate kinase [Lachnospiraceae bacterium]
MILAIDIGNTGIILGFYEKDQRVFDFSISSVPHRTADEYGMIFRLWCTQNRIGAALEGCVISCVVPPLKRPVEQAVKEVFGCPVLFVGHGIKTGLNIRVDNQTDVGSDIVANMVAASGKYSGPVAVVDFGTATTLSAVNQAGELIGVAIMPGVQVSLRALASSAAALPDISIGIPGRVLGKNTEESMLSGFVLGAAAMVDGMLKRLKAEMGVDTMTVIACGTLADRIVPHCDTRIEIWPHLTLDGLVKIYLLNQRKRSGRLRTDI